MSVRLIAGLASLAMLAAGCVAPNASIDAASANAPIELPSLDPSTFLFADAQNAPHPKFGWPTLIAPAVGDAVSPYWAPIEGVPLPGVIAGVAHVTATEGIASAGGISLFGSLAIVPGFGDVSYIVDITDPTAPKVLSEFEPIQGAHRGSAVVAYPDGTLVAAFSTGAGFELWDITDPKMPVNVAAVETPKGGHKLGIVPGTPILYNANSNGGGSNMADQGAGVIEIYDLTDPAKPELVQEFANGFGCHHVFFWNSAEKQRAVCAGIEFTQIIDTADPLNPVVIVSVPVHHGVAGTPSASIPIVAFSHFAILNDDATVLIVGDEMGGGGIPPGCTVGRQTPVVDVSVPTGALWFYDVSDETNPTLLGWWSPGHHLDPTNAMASCTAHHGRLVPQEDGRDLLAMSFYGAGVVLLDFSDPMMPKMVDQFMDSSNTWETWYYNGYLFTGDLNRGMDVLTFE